MDFITQPDDIVSAYAPLVFEISENTTVPTSTMVAVIEVQRNADQRWVSIGEKQQQAYRNAPLFRFEVSEFIQRELSHDYPYQDGSNVLINYNESALQFRLLVKHYIAGVFQTSTYSNQIVAVNTIPDDRTNTSLSEFIMQDAAVKSFLTPIKTHKLRKDEHLQFHFLFNEGQINTKAVMTKYPLSGSPSDHDIDILAYSHETASFQGFDTNGTLTSTPTLSYTNAELARITGSDGKEYVGVKIDASDKYVEIPSTDVGDTFKFEMFMYESGNVLLTFIDATTPTTDIIACDVGYNTNTSVAIPAGTTAIRVENKTSSECWLVYANIVEASQNQIPLNRGVLYIDEYDPTLEKIELYIQNDTDAISETLTVLMGGCSNGKRLAWLSKRGTIEHYTFTWGDASERNVEKSKILTEQLVPIGETRGIKTPFAQSSDVTTVYTYHETNEKMSWLAEIAESPEVYLVNSYNDRVPVDVITSNFPLGGRKLRQGSISFRPSYYNKIQNG